jgi:hypothetical protein
MLNAIRNSLSNGLLLLFIYLFILSVNVFVAGGSGTTIRHNTQNNTPY